MNRKNKQNSVITLNVNELLSQEATVSLVHPLFYMIYTYGKSNAIL